MERLGGELRLHPPIHAGSGRPARFPAMDHERAREVRALAFGGCKAPARLGRACWGDTPVDAHGAGAGVDFPAARMQWPRARALGVCISAQIWAGAAARAIRFHFLSTHAAAARKGWMAQIAFANAAGICRLATRKCNCHARLPTYGHLHGCKVWGAED